jgi:hypothetical protein
LAIVQGLIGTSRTKRLPRFTIVSLLLVLNFGTWKSNLTAISTPIYISTFHPYHVDFFGTPRQSIGSWSELSYKRNPWVTIPSIKIRILGWTLFEMNRTTVFPNALNSGHNLIIMTTHLS